MLPFKWVSIYKYTLLSPLILQAANSECRSTKVHYGMSSQTGENEDDSFLDALTNGEFEFVGTLVVPARGRSQFQVKQHTASQTPDQPLNLSLGLSAKQVGGALDASLSIRDEIYRADGEIKILRAQLDEVRSSKDSEIARLRDLVESLKQDHSSQVVGLKGMVDKLEDEKKFLNNELKSVFLASKRRKVTETQTHEVYPAKQVGEFENLINNRPQIVTASGQTVGGPVFSVRRNKKTNDQAWLLIDEVSSSSINGSLRTNFEILLKIYIDPGFKSEIDTFDIPPRTPLSNAIVKYLMNNKEVRLDILVDSFCRNIMQLVSQLILRNHTLSLPFLLSLIHTCVGFRPNAVGQDLILWLTEKIIVSIDGQLNLLEDGEASQIGFFDVPDQQLMFKKLYIICAMDTIEKLTILASSKEFSVWHLLPADLFRQCLPENSNTFVGLAQVNLVYNMVIMLQSSAGPDSFAYQSPSNDQFAVSAVTKNDCGIPSKEVINSLLKTFLIDIGIKQEFVFYGLNRVLGNNCDLAYIEQAIPLTTNILGHSMIAHPDPIRREKWQVTPLMKLRHEEHLLNLRILISGLLEYYVSVNPGMFMSELNYEEVVKAIIRVMGYEQNNLISCPRNRFTHLRLKIIASLVVVLYHMVYHKRANDIIYPETMYEIFVVLTRISFGNESLLVEAAAFLQRTRKLLVSIPIFNRWCEQRARELSHIEVSSPIVMNKGSEMEGQTGDSKLAAAVESEFANGIEFPYDVETVELARDVLNSFVDTVEADNLYYNMNCEEEPRDMRMEIEDEVAQGAF